MGGGQIKNSRNTKTHICFLLTSSYLLTITRIMLVSQPVKYLPHLSDRVPELIDADGLGVVAVEDPEGPLNLLVKRLGIAQIQSLQQRFNVRNRC